MLIDGEKLRIAVIKTDGIGDAVLASPFFFELRKYFKKARITGILSPAGVEVLGGLGVFDEIKVIDPKWLKYKKIFFLSRWVSALGLLLIINKNKYDIVIGLRWQDRLTSLVLSLCNAKEKYGYDVKGMGFGINHKIPLMPGDTHAVNKNLKVLSHIIPGKKFRVRLGFSSDTRSDDKVAGILKGMKAKKYIVMHPVSGHISKDWGIGNYKKLALKLAKKYGIFITGAAADTGIKEISGKNIHNMAGRLDIRETGALIKRALLVIGNDSAAVHIASAFNVRSLTLFSGTALHEEWGPYGEKSYILTKDAVCRMCGLADCDRPVHECMDFGVDYVEGLAAKIISGRQKSRIIRY